MTTGTVRPGAADAFHVYDTTLRDGSQREGLTLSVDVSAARHAISPDIYGLNGADPAFAVEIGMPVARWAYRFAATGDWLEPSPAAR